MTFKRMILYQKSIFLYKNWRYFEIILLSTLAFNYFDLKVLQPYIFYLIGFISLYGVVLSLNMKWVAYLNYKQKWKNILLLFIILLIATSFIEFIYNAKAQKAYSFFDINNNNLIHTTLGEKAFTISIFIFIVFYCISAILVTLFNLPTSSVFEQKFDEILNIQKLSDTLQFTDNINDIYKNFIDISHVATGSQACWLETYDKSGSIEKFLDIGGNKYDIFEVKNLLKKQKQLDTNKPLNIKDLRTLAGYTDGIKYKSLILIPLVNKSTHFGSIGLLKNLKDGFSQDDFNIANTLAQQASTAITNRNLLSNALKHADYQKEIKIAHEVKSKLLTPPVFQSNQFSVAAKYSSPEHIGGDFYSTGSFDNDHHYIAIADVAGHGTSAVFNMAQLKGIFEGTIQLQLPLNDLLSKINSALSNCIDKKTYVSMSIVYINTATKQFQIGRAGHHATLYYRAYQHDSIEEIKDPGLGLGILRNSDFSQHLKVSTRSYGVGDTLFLYTDGLVEAKNNKEEQYGLVNIKNEFRLNATKRPQEIVDGIYNKMLDFVEQTPIEDDVTCLTIKFLG